MTQSILQTDNSLAQVLFEVCDRLREQQDAQCGGPEYNIHIRRARLAMIHRFLGIGSFYVNPSIDPARYECAMLDIAVLAVKAIQSRRKRNVR